MNPTDPMTPVRALIEAAGKATPGPWVSGYWSGQCRKPEHLGNHPGSRGDNPCVYEYQIATGDYSERYVSAGTKENRIEIVGGNDDGPVGTREDATFIAAARNATASISQLLSEHDKVVALIAEWRELAAVGSSLPFQREPQRAQAKVYNACADQLKAIVEGK